MSRGVVADAVEVGIHILGRVVQPAAGLRQARQQRMDMGVPERGQQQPPAEIDDPRPRTACP